MNKTRAQAYKLEIREGQLTALTPEYDVSSDTVINPNSTVVPKAARRDEPPPVDGHGRRNWPARRYEVAPGCARHYAIYTSTGVVIVSAALPNSRTADSPPGVPPNLEPPALRFVTPAGTIAPLYEKFCLQNNLHMRDIEEERQTLEARCARFAPALPFFSLSRPDKP